MPTVVLTNRAVSLRGAHPKYSSPGTSKFCYLIFPVSIRTEKKKKEKTLNGMLSDRLQIFKRGANACITFT